MVPGQDELIYNKSATPKLCSRKIPIFPVYEISKKLRKSEQYDSLYTKYFNSCPESREPNSEEAQHMRNLRFDAIWELKFPPVWEIYQERTYCLPNTRDQMTRHPCQTRTQTLEQQPFRQTFNRPNLKTSKTVQKQCNRRLHASFFLSCSVTSGNETGAAIHGTGPTTGRRKPERINSQWPPWVRNVMFACGCWPCRPSPCIAMGSQRLLLRHECLQCCREEGVLFSLGLPPSCTCIAFIQCAECSNAL